MSLKTLLKNTRHMEYGMLLSSRYYPSYNTIQLKFYCMECHRIHVWYDDTGYMAYLLTREDYNVVKARFNPRYNKRVVYVDTVSKINPLTDRREVFTRIVAKTPSDVGGRKDSLRNYVENPYEADILFRLNYIYDKHLVVGGYYKISEYDLEPISYRYSGSINYEEHFKQILMEDIPRFNRCAVDIEVLNERDRMPDVHEANEPVVCVSIVDVSGNREVFILRRSDVDDNIDDTVGYRVHLYDCEWELIRDVLLKLEEYPIVVTFNGDEFDLQYLYNRATRCGIPSIYHCIEYTNDGMMLTHGIHLDVYKILSNRAIRVYAYRDVYENVSLDEVSRVLLGKQKIELDRHIGDLSLRELAEYCLHDSELTLELTTCNDDAMMKLLVTICRMCRLPLDYASRKQVGEWSKSTFMWFLRAGDMLIPRREEVKKGVVHKEDREKYQGALVFDPERGIHFNVSVIDFSSLYPSVIKQFNLSFETVNCVHRECMDTKYSFERVSRDSAGRERRENVEYWICRRHYGLASSIIKAVRELRLGYFKPRRYESSLMGSIEQILKVYMNALYGVQGNVDFAFFCLPVAELTTYFGRDIILNTKRYAEELGLNVIYGDTDSLMIPDLREDVFRRIEEWVSNTYGIDIEMDKQYRYIVLTNRKKNYLGVKSDGSPDIKGLTGKKKHVPVAIRSVFDRVVDVLSGVSSIGEFEDAKNRIRDILFEFNERLVNRDIPLEELAFVVNITKSMYKTTTQAVQVAKILYGDVNNIPVGERIEYIKVRDRDVAFNVTEGELALELARESVFRERGAVGDMDIVYNRAKSIRKQIRRNRSRIARDVNMQIIRHKIRDDPFTRLYRVSALPVSMTRWDDVDIGKYQEFTASVFRQILEPLEMDYNYIINRSIQNTMDGYIEASY